MSMRDPWHGLRIRALSMLAFLVGVDRNDWLSIGLVGHPKCM